MLEVIGIGQPEFGFGFIFFVLLLDMSLAAGAVEMWKSGAFCRISKPGGKSGNSLFEFSTLSTGRHFHGALPLGFLGA